MPDGPSRRFRGFTLVELAIVGAVLSLLAVTALPSWRDARLATRRADGIAALHAAAAALQRRRATSDGFDGATLGAGGVAPSRSAEGHYDLALLQATADAFTVQATPRGTQADDRCGRLTLDAWGQLLGGDGLPLLDGLRCR